MRHDGGPMITGNSFLGSRHSMGTMVMALYPAPDNVYPLEFIYRRRPRALLIDKYQDGTVATNNNTTVTGTGTAWAAKHIGSVLRISSDNVDYPTGPFGVNLAAYEQIITAVGSATSLTIDSTIPAVGGPFKYTISDPVDIEDGAMLTAFLRGCERQIAIRRVMKDRPDAFALYERALMEARDADVRTSVQRGVKYEWTHRLQPKNYPITADQA